MRYRGFEVFGESGDWTATSSDVQATGRTKDEAVNNALRERRGLAEDAEREDAEEREIDRIVYGPEEAFNRRD